VHRFRNHQFICQATLQARISGEDSLLTGQPQAYCQTPMKLTKTLERLEYQSVLLGMATTVCDRCPGHLSWLYPTCSILGCVWDPTLSKRWVGWVCVGVCVCVCVLSEGYHGALGPERQWGAALSARFSKAGTQNPQAKLQIQHSFTICLPFVLKSPA